MKYTLAVACLVGAVQLKKTQQDTTTVWSLKSVNDHRDDQAFQKFYGDYQTDAPTRDHHINPTLPSSLNPRLPPTPAIPMRTFKLEVTTLSPITPRSSTTPGMPSRMRKKVTIELSQLTSPLTLMIFS